MQDMEREPAKTVRSPEQAWTMSDAVVLLLTAIVLVAFRLHAFGLPLETDECNYAYIGARLLAGDRLYVDAWDHQPPGIFALFAAVIALLGSAPEVFRWMAVAASLASLGLIFVIAQRVGGRTAAWLAAVLFCICSADPGTAGEGCNREIFMNPPVLGALWLLLRRCDPRWSSVLTAGLLLGLTSTIKTVVAAQWLLLAVWLAVRTGRRSESTGRPRRILAALLCFSVGPAAVWGATAAYFVGTGRGHEFYDAVFAFNRAYSQTDAGYWRRYVDFFRAPVHRYVFSGTWPLWIAGGVGAVVLPLLLRRRGLGRATALLACLLGSYWAVCLPGQFWPHYYYLMLPPLVLVTAAALAELTKLAPERPSGRAALWTGRIAGGVLVAALLGLQAREYLLVPTLKITDRRYDSRDRWGQAQGRNVAKVTDPDDTVLVYAHDAGVYYYSGRRCATRYTMLRALDEHYPGYEQRRGILLEEVQARRPRVVLLVEQPFPELEAFLRANYYLVGQDYHDRRPDEVIMAALMDKSRPIPQIDWNWHR